MYQSSGRDIHLFSSLFKGREDVFAIRWEKGAKSGYMPAYLNGRVGGDREDAKAQRKNQMLSLLCVLAMKMSFTARAYYFCY
jgi:hypothetical protein